MTQFNRSTDTFGGYFGMLWKVILTSTFPVALIIGIVMLFSGGSEMHIDGDIDLGTFGALWVLLALPIVALLAFLIFSPLSYPLYRLLTRSTGNKEEDPAQ